MAVTREDVEQALGRLRAQAPDPRAGLFGPRSVTWQVNKEAIVFLGGGRAALLQLAHPAVAHAIDQHSKTRADIPGRFQRTFENVFAMVFGDLDHALGAARRVFAIHERIRGQVGEDVGVWRSGVPYDANQVAALVWVLATLTDTSVLVYERFVRRLSAAEKDAYAQEARRFGALFGIPERAMPEGWAGFRAYVERTLASGLLGVGRTAADIGHYILEAPRPLLRPLMDVYRLATTALLPPRFRSEYGLRFGPLERAAWRASLPLARVAYGRLPRRVRYLPAYVEARRRLAGKHAPDAIGLLIDRAVLHLLARPRPA